MSRRSGERRSTGARRWAWIGGVAGALAVSGALLAVLYERGGSEPVGDKASSDRPVEVADEQPSKTEWHHTYLDSYGGPVWITVTSSDSRVRSLTITWGPWQRLVAHEGTEPVSYLFSKDPGTSVPIEVRVEPEANVTFHSGTPPVGADDINLDWTRISG